MDAEIVAVVDELLALVLMNEMESVIGRRAIGLDQRLMDAVANGSNMRGDLPLSREMRMSGMASSLGYMTVDVCGT